MVKLHHYSQSKFTAFSEDKQIKAIVELLTALEANLPDAEFRKQLIQSILDCLKWSSPEVREKLFALPELRAETGPHEIIEIITPVLRLYKHHYNENDPEIYRFDGLEKTTLQNVPYPLTVVVDNLRSAYNLGSIFRTAECVRAAHLYLCGITPTPAFPQVQKSSMGTENRIDYTSCSETEEAIRMIKEQGIPVIALETVSNAKSLFNYKPSQSVAVILGNEALGIDEKILKLADEVLYIPVYGWKNSLNVSNAFAVAAYWLSGLIK